MGFHGDAAAVFDHGLPFAVQKLPESVWDRCADSLYRVCFPSYSLWERHVFAVNLQRQATSHLRDAETAVNKAVRTANDFFGISAAIDQHAKEALGNLAGTEVRDWQRKLQELERRLDKCQNDNKRDFEYYVKHYSSHVPLL